MTHCLFVNEIPVLDLYYDEDLRGVELSYKVREQLEKLYPKSKIVCTHFATDDCSFVVKGLNIEVVKQ